MKFVQLFEEYNAVTVDVFDTEGMYDIFSQDNTIAKRIRYSDQESFGYFHNKVNPYYVVLKKNDLVIGICKIGYYSMSSKHKNNYCISYFSIDKNYRSFGYSRIMCDVLFKFAKEKGFDISTSSYSINGKEYLKHLFNEYANKYGVVFNDTDETIDTESQYVSDINGKKYHKSELKN